MAVEMPLFPDSELGKPQVEQVDSGVQTIITQFREYLAFAEFDSSKARAFRDFTDFFDSAAIRSGDLERDEDGADPEITYALVCERVSSRISDNREYAYSFARFISFFSRWFTCRWPNLSSKTVYCA